MAQIISGQRKLQYSELNHHIACAARAFRGAGIRAGDAVALLLRNDFAFFEASLTARAIGAYATPINWHNTLDEVKFILDDCGARLLVVHADLYAPLRGLLTDDLVVVVVDTPPELAAAYSIDQAKLVVDENDITWSNWLKTHAEGAVVPPSAPTSSMIYTSGTTGRPKGVRRAPYSDSQLIHRNRTSAEAYGLVAGENATILINGPMYHSAPNAYGLLACILEFNIILQPRFDPEETLQIIERNKITHLHAVPTMFVRLLKLPNEVRERYDLSSLRFVTHGAAPCPTDVKQRMIAWWGPVINEYYGSTETGLVVANNSAEALAKPGTVGRALPECVVKIFDDDGDELSIGHVGDIYLGAPSIGNFTYHGCDEQRLEIGRGELVTVGDIGWLDSDGYLFLCDRKRDMIISGGVNIYPAEIEAALLSLDGVRDCAVFGIPDEEYGEAVLAVIERDGTAEVDVLQARTHLGARLARYKLPRHIEFADQLPREDSGKIFKRKLRAPYWEGKSQSI